MGYLRWALTVAVIVAAALRGKGPLVVWARRFHAAVARWWRHDRWLRPSLWDRLTRRTVTPDPVVEAIDQIEAEKRAAAVKAGDVLGHTGAAERVAPHIQFEVGPDPDVLRERLVRAHARERDALTRRMRERGM